jgi:uncharacterized membrane protein YccC
MQKQFIVFVPGLCSGFTVVIGTQIAVFIFHLSLLLSGAVMVIVGIFVGLLVWRIIKKGQP